MTEENTSAIIIKFCAKVLKFLKRSQHNNLYKGKKTLNTVQAMVDPTSS